jgi:hypothetical protein
MLLSVCPALLLMLPAAIGPREVPFSFLGACDEDFSLFASWIELTRRVV